MRKLNVFDLFAGCGGLGEGFENSKFKVRASVEWDAAAVKTLEANAKRGHVVHHCDVRAFDEYLTSSNSSKPSLLQIAKDFPIDGVVGGPPCQAYSLAGRIRCPNGMKDDYRNFLFEAYIQVLKTVRPGFFVFENVIGMLSSAPGGKLVTERLTKSFNAAGYYVPKIDRYIVQDLAEYGGPQRRKRVILFGVDKKRFGKESEILVNDFYQNLSLLKQDAISVGDAIGDLPKLKPLKRPLQRQSHSVCSNEDPLHIPRFHNERDIWIFRLLAKDANKKNPEYKSIDALKALYTEMTGKKSSVHKYYVLEADGQSNLIPAHLYKDGLRHIHYDPTQARSITMREAARLQTFPDSYKFIGSQGDIYKMIGNAVPPMLAKAISEAVFKTIKRYI